MIPPQPATPPTRSSPARIGGAIALLVLGILSLMCGCGYALTFYLTEGFFEFPIAAVHDLGHLGYGNLLIAGCVLCPGIVATLVGVILMVGRRRAPR